MHWPLLSREECVFIHVCSHSVERQVDLCCAGVLLTVLSPGISFGEVSPSQANVYSSSFLYTAQTFH